MSTSPITISKDVAPAHRLRLRWGERRMLLLFGDLLVSGLALVIAMYLRAQDINVPFNLDFITTRMEGWFFFMPVPWLLMLVELYDERRASNWQQTVKSLATAALVALGLYLVTYFFFPPKSLPRRSVAYFLASATALTLIWRVVYIRVFTAAQFMHRVLLVGAGETGQMLLRSLREIIPAPFHVIGLIDDDENKIGKEIEGYLTLGGSDKLLEVIRTTGISDIIVAISGDIGGQMFQALLDAQERGVLITRFPVAYEELFGRVPIRYLEADWILRSFVDQARVSTFFELEKRLFDIAGGLVGLGIFIILFPIISVAILLDSGWPVFYRQTRSGRGDQPYRITKFRTMRTNAEPDGLPQWAEENDKRATRVGILLRKTHLDELPQFINILKGEMSLVGPRAERPELVSWFEKHVPFYRARLLVKPGLTGWAQINQTYAATIDETITKLEYDLYYIKRRNLALDLMILLRTPAMVFGFRGR